MENKIFIDILKLIQPVRIEPKLRLGREFDGGYVLSEKLLNESDLLISFGINNEWSFESDFFRKKDNSTLLMFDDQFESKAIYINVLKGFIASFYRIGNNQVRNSLKNNLKLLHSWIDFIKSNPFRVKYLKARIGHNIENNEISLGDIILKYGIKNKQNILLKIDIEGSEYEIVEEMVVNNRYFSGVVIEFHDVHSKPQLFKEMIELLKTKFTIEHVHFNNYTPYNGFISDALELTLIHNKFYDNKGVPIDKLPLEGFDFACNSQLPDYDIIFEAK